MTASSTTTAIVPSDFVKRTTDYEYKHYGVDAMRYIVTALKQEPVAIIIEAGTGFTMFDVTLQGVQKRGGRDSRVIIRSTFKTGDYHDIAYRIDELGAIIPMGENNANAKWDALGARHQDLMAKVAN